MPHILAECGTLKMRGGGRDPVAFRAALGDCLGSSTLIAAAMGTKGDFEGEITSIEASFDFHPLKTRKLS